MSSIPTGTTYFARATKVRLTPLNINSRDINTTKTLLRASVPYNPMQNMIAATIIMDSRVMRRYLGLTSANAPITAASNSKETASKGSTKSPISRSARPAS